MIVTSASVAPTTSVPGLASICACPALVMRWIDWANEMAGAYPRAINASGSSTATRRPQVVRRQCSCCGAACSTLPSSGHDVGTAKILPLVARHLHPLAVLELRDFVHLHLIDGHLAVLVGDPEVEVVDLI